MYNNELKTKENEIQTKLLIKINHNKCNNIADIFIYLLCDNKSGSGVIHWISLTATDFPH